MSWSPEIVLRGRSAVIAIIVIALIVLAQGRYKYNLGLAHVDDAQDILMPLVEAHSLRASNPPSNAELDTMAPEAVKAASRRMLDARAIEVTSFELRGGLTGALRFRIAYTTPGRRKEGAPPRSAYYRMDYRSTLGWRRGRVLDCFPWQFDMSPWRSGNLVKGDSL